MRNGPFLVENGEALPVWPLYFKLHMGYGGPDGV